MPWRHGWLDQDLFGSHLVAVQESFVGRAIGEVKRPCKCQDCLFAHFSAKFSTIESGADRGGNFVDRQPEAVIAYVRPKLFIDLWGLVSSPEFC